jgi:hypothetical protein
MKIAHDTKQIRELYARMGGNYQIWATEYATALGIKPEQAPGLATLAPALARARVDFCKPLLRNSG